MWKSFIHLFLCALSLAAPLSEDPLAAVHLEVEQRQSAPEVTIANGTVVGIAGDVESFSGIPFAQPPVGSLRLRPPQILTEGFSGGTFEATSPAAACPQFAFQVDYLDTNLQLAGFASSVISDIIGELINSQIGQTAVDQQEDCLTLTVQRPAGTTSDSKLPVIFWIFGGGFEAGWSSMYDGTNFVQSSINLGKPVVYVAVGYRYGVSTNTMAIPLIARRVGGYGFLAGEQLAAEGSTNLGLRDQRLGLQWVAENIAAFGGDPDKVTIWGESAGAISVLDHTIINGGDHTYNGKPLFRAGIMNSGSIVPATDVTSAKAQAIYDDVVASSSCAGVDDSLTCLRALSYDEFQTAVTSVPGIFSYSSLDLSYLPRPDPGDKFFAQSPEMPIQNGQFAQVPVIIGDQEDEGTLFGLVTSNITTNSQLVEYIASYFPAADDPSGLAEGLAAQYPDEILLGQPDGSPFGTDSLNSIYPQFKRLAAILGDITFTLTRRVFLDAVTKQGVTARSYLSTYFYGTAILGTFHASDIVPAFFTLPNATVPTRSIHTYYINFINDLDPNDAGNADDVIIDWPEWTNASVELLEFGALGNVLQTDDFREGAYEYLVERISEFRI